ncbi:hypothetical protein BGX26_011988 [Mortierella sp. AD094]|nr:hypothetical protein BGX26_011988 [Mortierella sp. AD094]
MGASCCKEEAIDFNSEIELSHFHLLRSVGKGAFGKVRVVQHKKTKEIYALKYINKAKCIRMRAVENIIQERRLLEEVEFSLICNLRYAFQDDENLFMVLDLMLGGDLRFHLERAGPMREDVVRFYIAEVALALDALHARRIIHRDLKPDNVLLDEHGHAHLTDFNIAVYYNPAKPLMSVAGSMAYMAPEVLLRKGYLESVDWWSLGVVMFELLFGNRPFRGKSNELLTNSILRDPLPFPENVMEIVSEPCLDVLSQLCERDINKRLGCTAEGMDAFKKHPWFEGIEWDKLVKKEATPPFEPDSKRANFDATHELEELLMEDNPLKAKKRVQASPDTELSAEMQMMEDKFITYDYTKVRRSHSISRPASGSSRNLLRSGSAGHERKMSVSSTTLDGVLTTRNSSGRLDNLPNATIPTKAFRPDSPSDLVGRDRFNPDEDEISIISMSEATDNTHSVHPMQQSQETLQLTQKQQEYPSAEAEKAALQKQDQQQEQYQAQLEEQKQEQYQAQLEEQKQEQDPDSAVVPPITIAAMPQLIKRQSSRDHLTSVRSAYADSITPSSPSYSASAYSASAYSTLSTPPTTYNNSPATQTVESAGTALFSTQESSAPLSALEHTDAPLMDSAMIPAPVTVRPRTLKSRQPSQSAKGGRAFELSSQAQQEKLHQYHQHQRHPSIANRPMSEYTTGSVHDTMLDQDSKLPHQHPFRASISGIDGLSGLGLGLGGSPYESLLQNSQQQTQLDIGAAPGPESAGNVEQQPTVIS